jgi:gamma-glutamylcyclotransferase (GGCT)/AIG2-like uncharacterized protein YtfP
MELLLGLGAAGRAVDDPGMADRLFVYGTLAPGRPNEHVLADVPGAWEPATVRGVLHELGWGAVMGYPALVLDEHGPEVEGFVFSSESLGEHWQRLDEFEGDGYERLLTSVTLLGGESVEAHIYVLRRVAEAWGSTPAS